LSSTIETVMGATGMPQFGVQPAASSKTDHWGELRFEPRCSELRKGRERPRPRFERGVAD
jgi:hypothetical protein